MNNVSLVLTVIGEDKPGLVEQLAALVVDHRGNWLESSMARLAGQFAGILHVEVPTEHRAALSQALRKLDEKGLKVTVISRDVGDDLPSAQSVELDLVGNDRPGIVRQITRVIASHGVNVQKIETTTESAAMSAELLFRAHATLAVPAATDLGKLQADLERVSHDLMVDLTLG